MRNLSLYCMLCAFMLPAVYAEGADKKEPLWEAFQSENMPRGKAEQNDGFTRFSVPDMGSEQRNWAGFGSVFNGKEASEKKVRIIQFKLRAGNQESVGKRLAISLNVSRDQRYWMNIPLRSMEWSTETVTLSGVPPESSVLKLSPEITDSELAQVNGISIVVDNRGGAVGKLSFDMGRLELLSKAGSGTDLPVSRADAKVSGLPVSLDNLPVTSDNHKRPLSRDGIFYEEGKASFIIGVNLCQLHPTHVKGKKNAKLQAATGDDPIYNRMLNSEEFRQLGITSIEWEAIPPAIRYTDNPFISTPVVRTGIEKLVTWATWRTKEQRSMAAKAIEDINLKSNTEQLSLLKDMPVIADYTQGFDNSEDMLDRVKDAGIPATALESVNGWVTALESPWCSSDPVGRDIENSYFKGGAWWLLRNGANPWIYEVWNELHYFNCTCSINQQKFIAYLKRNYSDLNDINSEWGTDFRSYEAIVSQKNYRNCRGMWADWMKFTGNLWQDALIDSAAQIRSVDRRPDTYITWQIANQSIFYPVQGADIYKGTQVVDCFGYEGGMRFEDEASKEHEEDALLGIVYGWGKHSHKFFSDISRSVSPDKPVLNLEMYRGSDAPATANNFVTGLWSEAVHGVASAQYYVWWMHPATDPDKPNKQAHIDQSLLNPRACPREALSGLKTFKAEFDRLAPLIAPRPRIKGTAALLFSQPSVWQEPQVRAWYGQKYTLKDKILNFYEALHLSHHPVDVIMEEHLREGRAGQYRAIVVPGSEYAYKESSARLEKFVSDGGILIVCGSGLLYNEYGKRTDDTALLGLIREEFPEKFSDSVAVLSRPGLPDTLESASFNKVKLVSAKVVLAAKKSGRPAVTENRIGKGTVYFVSMEDLAGSPLIALLDSLLRRSGINPPADLTRVDGNFAGNVEIQRIDRGENQVHYLVNWNSSASAIYKLMPAISQGVKFYVTDLISCKYLPSKSGREWSRSELEQGIDLLLPAQERTLILVSSKPYPGADIAVNADDYGKRLDSLKKAEAGFLTARKEAAVAAARDAAEERRNQVITGVRTGKCLSISLDALANMGFIDEKEGDQKGGWLDQGDRDLRSLPVGKQVFANVPFTVIDPAQNSGKSCIMLQSAVRSYFPHDVKIPVSEMNAAKLYFLHGGGWISDSEIATYIVRYKDGSCSVIPVRGNQEIADWYGASILKSGAKLGWEGSNPVFKKIGLYVFEWINPYPEKKISGIELVSAGKQGTVGVIAITAEEP